MQEALTLVWIVLVIPALGGSGYILGYRHGKRAKTVDELLDRARERAIWQRDGL